MQRPLHALLVLAALLAIALVDPTAAQCKVKAGNTSVPTAEASVHAANATEPNAAAPAGSEVGSDANYGPVSSSNKIQNAPKKRMKNKLLFDVTKPVKTSTTSSNN